MEYRLPPMRLTDFFSTPQDEPYIFEQLSALRGKRLAWSHGTTLRVFMIEKIAPYDDEVLIDIVPGSLLVIDMREDGWEQQIIG